MWDTTNTKRMDMAALFTEEIMAASATVWTMDVSGTTVGPRSPSIPITLVQGTRILVFEKRYDSYRQCWLVDPGCLILLANSTGIRLMETQSEVLLS
jgi:hypothetical protein